MTPDGKSPKKRCSESWGKWRWSVEQELLWKGFSSAGQRKKKAEDDEAERLHGQKEIIDEAWSRRVGKWPKGRGNVRMRGFSGRRSWWWRRSHPQGPDSLWAIWRGGARRLSFASCQDRKMKPALSAWPLSWRARSRVKEKLCSTTGWERSILDDWHCVTIKQPQQGWLKKPSWIDEVIERKEGRGWDHFFLKDSDSWVCVASDMWDCQRGDIHMCVTEMGTGNFMSLSWEITGQVQGQVSTFVSLCGTTMRLTFVV